MTDAKRLEIMERIIRILAVAVKTLGHMNGMHEKPDGELAKLLAQLDDDAAEGQR